MAKKKHSKRYMKRAARRTIAALLMISALIVAAIPATPSKADAGFSSATYKYDDPGQGWTFYFDGSDDNLALVHISTYSGLDAEGNQITQSTDITIPSLTDGKICTSIASGAITGSSDLYEPDGSGNNVCKITTFTAPTVKTVASSAFQGATRLETYTGKATTNIETSAFEGCTALTNCYPDTNGVETIGSRAFMNSGISAIPYSQYITSIGSYAFANSNLQGRISIPGPDEGTSVGPSALADHVFYGCKDISDVEFTGNFNDIGDYSFANCPTLNTIILPDGISSIPANLFKMDAGDSKLSQITIPGGVSSLPSGLLSACNNLVCLHLNNNSEAGGKNISIDGSLPSNVANMDSFYVEGYKNYTVAGVTNPSDAYDYCMDNKVRYKWLDGDKGTADKFFDITDSGKLVNVRIDKYLNDPAQQGSTIIDLGNYSSITSIASDAFGKDPTGASKVTELYIGGNITSISDKALSYFNNIEKFKFDGNTVIDDSAADGGVFPSGTNYYIFGAMEKDSDSSTLNQFEYAAKYGKEYRTETALGSSGNITLYSTGDYALTGAVLSDGTKSNEKISSATGISEISIPSGIETINEKVFKEDTGLTNLQAGGLKTLCDYQFQSCTNLSSVTLTGNTLEEMGKLPFQSCTGIHSMTIGSDLFACDGNGVITGPDKAGDPANSCIIEALENYSTDSGFGYDYTLPTSVTSIRERAFESNQHLSSFTSNNGDNYSSTIDSIPEGCFHSCKVLKSITLGKGITQVGEDAFTNQSMSEITNTVYQPTVTYNYPNRNSYDPSGNTKYYFYSTSNDDSTYYLCNPKGVENTDNLIWKGLYSELDPKDLSKCTIKYVNGNTLKYTGSNLTWTPTDSSMDGDFYVIAEDGKTILTPDTHYTLQDLGDIIEEKQYAFILNGINEYSGVLTGMFSVTSGSSTSTLTDGDVTINEEMAYTGEVIKMQAVTSIDNVINDGQFCVTNSAGVPLTYLTDYGYKCSKQVKNTGNYEIIITGLDGTIYDGQTLKKSFKVVDSPSPTGTPAPTGTPTPTPTPDPGTGKLAGAKVWVYNEGTFQYTGADITLSPQSTAKRQKDGEFFVTDVSGNVLKPDTDYTFTPLKVKDAGSYTLRIDGLGSYIGGKVSATINVVAATPTPTPVGPDPEGSGALHGATIVVFNNGDFTYTGSDIRVIAQKTDSNKQDGEFYVVVTKSNSQGGASGANNSAKGEVLKPTEEYTWSPNAVRESGDYMLEVIGKGPYEGGRITCDLHVNPRKTISVNFLLNGPDRSAADPATGKYSNTFQYWNEGVPAIRRVMDRYGNELQANTDYEIKGYGTIPPGIGHNTGYCEILFKGRYADEERQKFYYDIKKDLSYNTALAGTDGTKSVKIVATDNTYTGDTVNAKFTINDDTTGEDLKEGNDYSVFNLRKVSNHEAEATIQGKGQRYTGSYTFRFPVTEKKEDPSSSSSSSGGSSSGSSSSGSSSMARSSSMAGSSSTGIVASPAKTNSGTTLVNRNYYNTGNGSADELEDMLKAAHIDSINGGTADGYQINITKDDDAEARFRDALLRRYGTLDNIRYYSMDIDLRDKDGNQIDTTGITVTMTLPLPSSMEQYGANNRVATVDFNGDLEDLGVQYSTIDGRPCATFTAPHFSPYGFYVDTSNLAVGTLDNTPKTGDPISPKWFISLGLAALSIFLFLKKDPKRVRQAA